MELVEDYVVGTAGDTLLPRRAFDGMALIQAGIARLLDTDVDTHHVHAALELIDSVDNLSRQLDAAQTKVFDSIDRTGVHTIDGHRTAKAMIAQAGKLSGVEADARGKTMRALRALPAVRAGYDAGLISTCMVNKLGRVYSNPRIRDVFADADSWFAEHAINDTYEFFDLVVSQWQELADQDGAERRDKRADQSRNHRMNQNEDGTWSWEGTCAAYDGALTNDVFEAFEKIEFDIDWQWVLDTYGPDKACGDLMPRTAAQRRADAYAKVHVYAAKALKADGGPDITTDVVIDDETFEHETLKLLGESVEPTDPCREEFTCRTLSGSVLNPRTAVAHALLGHLRRVVVGADSVTIDLGRRRLFTGYARLAAQLQADECYWPGCHVNVTKCQVDHITPHADRGRDPTTGLDRGGGGTNPANGGALCGTHNRHKEHGYAVSRLPNGTIEIRRPDDTTLT
ncbi:MAG: hypothetical protein ACI8Y4_004015 [Candidatus Poriferisodalaceae bacterium]|jgi:hypothetical protein